MDDPETLSKTMTENYLANKTDLDADGTRLLMFWDIPQYYEAGLQLGFLFEVLIGPIPTQTDMEFLS